jgi:hypothetical protein
MVNVEVIKLTRKQNAIIYCLQNGWVLITSKDHPQVLCCTKELEFWITSSMFWKLVNMGLIYQQLSYPFDWVLTREGKEFKTKPVSF